MCQLINVSALCIFDNFLNLSLISKKLPNFKYNPSKFSGCIWKCDNPKGTVLLFRTGKCMIVGVKVLGHIEDIVILLKKILSSIIKVEIISIEYTNLVSSDQLDFQINLRSFALEHYKSVQWEPELFPALLYRDKKLKVTALIFYQGKIILTGSKSVDNIKHLFKKLHHLLQNHKR